jgi:predicted DCC family thiol-disulfide oxidoreductase YuxK
VDRAKLLYDDDCGFCRWIAARILRWNRRGSIRALPLQGPEAEALLAGMDPAQRMASWHLATTDGAVRSGAAAVAPLARMLPGGRPIAYAAELSPGLTRLAYRLVARHRGTLGRLIGAKACSVDPSRIAV